MHFYPNHYTRALGSLNRQRLFDSSSNQQALPALWITAKRRKKQNVGESLGTITRKVDKHSPTFEAISLFWLIPL